MSTDTPLLSIEDLAVEFRTRRGAVHAVRGLSYRLRAGETLAIVGESGSGKSVSALSLMRLIAEPAGRIRRGRILFEGRNLLDLSEKAMRGVRGNDISMIFQEPMTSLNPVLTIARQIGEAVRLHQGVGRAEARARALAMLRRVHIPDAERRLDQYPHELSGGMRQRVMIAMALACDPKILIADEPTTALDVTIQAQILRLLAQLQADLGLALLLITHDLGVVARVAHQVSVMYAGEVVENAATADLFAAPRHPYTRGLLDCLPIPGKVAPGAPLGSIPGMVPKLTPEFTGCGFRSRCSLARAECAAPVPMRGSPHHYRCVVDA